MFKRISIFALALVLFTGCSDPVGLDAESPVAESRIDREFAPPKDERTKMTIADVAIAVNAQTGEFSSLIAALSRVNLVGAVDGNTLLTVFAPTDAAFAALLNELGASSLDDIDDATLTSVLLYHVVPGRWYSGRVLGANKLNTLNGDKLKVDAGDVSIIDVNGREANILVGAGLFDITARNGVIHVIDKVVLPGL